MSTTPPRESNWLAIISLAILIMSAGGIGYYQFVFRPATEVSVFIPPPKEIVYVSVVEGSLDPANEGFFAPEEIIIVLGINHTIVWTNDDPGILHTVTSIDRSSEFGEAAAANNYIDPGSSWNYTFTHPGEFKYKCTPHPHMMGVIHVLPLPDELIPKETDEMDHNTN